ncbi:recombination protein RecR [Thiolapillus brandeum]|uniref:Recombination protein RecR n=2 Tax=Thiolapillus brandeum TaxID=1076588 RepID=A0A7U6GIY5_9GAMM|nr:recombination protein RecR [Thiolapillus brandeum]
MDSFCCLPGVGPKTAQRMAFHILERDREGGRRLAGILEQAVAHIGHCKRCRTLSEDELCRLCASEQRNDAQLCIVETPADVFAIEQATDYRGRYFVLGGRLSPLDGIGPAEIGLPQLASILAEGRVEELILATNPTVEGEATAQYIGDMAAEAGISATRIAHGVPLGGELEYVDGGTLAHAFLGRRRVGN